MYSGIIYLNPWKDVFYIKYTFNMHIYMPTKVGLRYIGLILLIEREIFYDN